MCFSLQASIITAGSLGILSLLYTGKEFKQRTMMIALIPLLFSIQQTAEAFVWRFFKIKKTMITTYATYAFLLFAYVIWPVWVPISLWLIETDDLRKKLILITLAIGGITSAFLGYTLYINTIKVTVDCAHIVYQTIIPDRLILPALISYTIATVGPWFISSVYRMWFIGILMLLGYGISLCYYLAAFTSVWCFFAAVVSASLFIVLDALRKRQPLTA